jgi:hypothetical protein
MCSVPFAYSVGVFILSNLSLALAMADNLNGGTSENPLNLPVQVDTSVRVSQYVGKKLLYDVDVLVKNISVAQINICHVFSNHGW